MFRDTSLVLNKMSCLEEEFLCYINRGRRYESSVAMCTRPVMQVWKMARQEDNVIEINTA